VAGRRATGLEFSTTACLSRHVTRSPSSWFQLVPVRTNPTFSSTRSLARLLTAVSAVKALTGGQMGDKGANGFGSEPLPAGLRVDAVADLLGPFATQAADRPQLAHRNVTGRIDYGKRARPPPFPAAPSASTLRCTWPAHRPATPREDAPLPDRQAPGTSDRRASPRGGSSSSISIGPAAAKAGFKNRNVGRVGGWLPLGTVSASTLELGAYVLDPDSGEMRDRRLIALAPESPI
jgi:hypothetical protein